MAHLRYVSHPNVQVDPGVPVPRWSLSPIGRERARQLLTMPWVPAVARVLSSPETKAIETASIVADHLGLAVEIRADTGEIDRSATGFVPPARHEELADAFFAQPARSVEGWERALDAQARIADALADVVARPVDEPDDVLVVGHGGVGTLLYCQLAGLAIDRRHDQPDQGNYWSYDRTVGRVLHPWRPIG